MLIAYKDFKDEEYFVPKGIFEKNNLLVQTVSTEKGKAIGVDGGEVEVDMIIEEIDDFDALVLVGGPGCLKFLDNEKVYQIVEKAFLDDKIIGAICIAPVILAKAGILKEREATVWSSSFNKTAIEILEKNGAIYGESFSVIQDNNIITAPGPSVAKDFAKEVSNNL